jgi:hypothetical protein
MPEITIADATLARLQNHAVPLLDTFDTVINRVFDAYEAQNGSGTVPTPPEPLDTARTFEASSPPDLTYTKVLSAKFDGSPLAKGVNWNGLLKQAVRLAKSRAKSADELKRLIIINFVPGKREGDGYEYLADADLSVQGQDANNAWRGIFHLAQQLGVSVEVMFLWRHKEKAALPGETGRLSIAPVPVR